MCRLADVVSYAVAAPGGPGPGCAAGRAASGLETDRSDRR